MRRSGSVIFVSVGSQAPFDRLIRAVDEWARERGRTDVFAQIAEGAYSPKHVEFTRFVDPAEFKRLTREARLIVAHAGMGSIISALELGKPIVVMPRQGSLRETRNDHQVPAARHFGEQGYVIVAADEHEISETYYALTLKATSRIGAAASPQLITTIQDFLRRRIRETRPTDSERAGKSGFQVE